MSSLRVRSARLFGVATLATLLVSSARAVITRDDQPDSAYLNLGSSPEYAAVGAFVNDWGYAGTGILLAADWVLTAAHNLALASSGTFTIGGTAYTATQLFMHPSYVYGNSFAGYDVGLAHLSTPVTSLTPVLPYAGTDEIGPTLTFVGYGFKGTGLTGYNALDNKKRAFQNVADGDFGNPAVLLGCDFDNPHNAADNWFGTATVLDLEGCVAPGDSGGGVFITVESQTYLTGVISFVAGTDGNANGDYGDVSGFGRLSAFLPWISSKIPEPSAVALLVGGSVALLLARRRSRRPPETSVRRG